MKGRKLRQWDVWRNGAQTDLIRMQKFGNRNQVVRTAASLWNYGISQTKSTPNYGLVRDEEQSRVACRARSAPTLVQKKRAKLCMPNEESLKQYANFVLRRWSSEQTLNV